MRKLGITRVRKSSSFNTFDSFIFFSLLCTTALFKLKMVVSRTVKSTRKVLDPWRLLGAKFNEVLLTLFYVKDELPQNVFKVRF